MKKFSILLLHVGTCPRIGISEARNGIRGIGVAVVNDIATSVRVRNATEARTRKTATGARVEKILEVTTNETDSETTIENEDETTIVSTNAIDIEALDTKWILRKIDTEGMKKKRSTGTIIEKKRNIGTNT